MVQWWAFLLWPWEVPGLNLVPQNEYSDRLSYSSGWQGESGTVCYSRLPPLPFFSFVQEYVYKIKDLNTVGKIKGEMDVTRRRGRRRKKLLDDPDRRGYSHLKEEALDRTMWRNRFGGGLGPVVRQTAYWIIIIIIIKDHRAGTAQSVQRLATGWTVRGSRFSAPVQTGPGAYPASCTTGTGSFPGVKLPVRGADHPPPSKCGGHERVGLYLYSPSGPSWPVIGRTFTFTFTFITDHSKTWSVRLRTKLLEKLHMNSLAPTNNAPADAFTCNSVERLPVYEPVNSFVCPTLRYLTTPRTDNIM